MKRSIIYLVLLICVSTPANACIGARQAAMGWSGVAIADDATCSYWNPAAIVWAKDGFMYESIWGSTDLAAKYGSFGFHYVNERDKWYYLVSYGKQLTNNSAFGFNVGWEEVNTYYSSYKGPAADLSFVWSKDNLTLAVLAQNIGNIRPAIAYKNDFAVITANVYDMLDLCQLRHFQIGMEITPIPYFALRAGYNQYYACLTYGVGFTASILSLDIAWLNNDPYLGLRLVL